VFRRIVITDSAESWSLVSRHRDHLFRDGDRPFRHRDRGLRSGL